MLKVSKIIGANVDIQPYFTDFEHVFPVWEYNRFEFTAIYFAINVYVLPFTCVQYISTCSMRQDT